MRRTQTNSTQRSEVGTSVQQQWHDERPVALRPSRRPSPAGHFRLRFEHSLTAMHAFNVVLHRVRLGLDEKTGERVALKILKKKEMGMTADVIKQVVDQRSAHRSSTRISSDAPALACPSSSSPLSPSSCATLTVAARSSVRPAVFL